MENQQIKYIISSDSHIIEPPDLWTTRIDKKFRDVAPHVERISGSDWWIYKGKRIGSVSGRKRRSGSINNDDKAGIESKGKVLTHSTFEDVNPAAYIPELYLQENLNDGVVGAVIRPTQGITNYCISEADIFGAICYAYNDWISDFVSVAPHRLKPIAMLNNYNPKDAVRELKRAKENGFVGGIVSVYPGENCSYRKPEYDILWSAAEDLEMPISFHALSNHNGPYGVAFPEINYSLRINADYWVRMSLADMIFGGVFDRHPKLIIEITEHEGGWIPYFLWQMDWTFENRIKRRLLDSSIKHMPSKYFRDNIYTSIIYDRVAIEARQTIGISKIMWGSDFPHEQSTHPNSQQFLSELMKGLPESEIQKIIFDNAAQLYCFDPVEIIAKN